MKENDKRLREEWMITQYVWTLENDGVFMAKTQQDVQAGRFSVFRRLCGRHIDDARKANDETQVGSISGPEWSFLYLETWIRMGGDPTAQSFWNHNDANEFSFQLERLNAAGYVLTAKGPMKSARNCYPGNENPCSEIRLPMAQPKPEPQPQQEKTIMSIISITNVTYINGTPIEQIKDEQLIGYIKQTEADIADLKSIKTKSEKIKSKIADLEGKLTQVVAILDAR